MAIPYTAATFIVKSYHTLINQIFPSSCVNCDQEGPWLCEICQGEIIQIQALTCPFCNRLSAGGKTCSRCQSTYKLTGLRAVWYYKDSLRTLIHKFKYSGLLSSQEFVLPYLHDLYAQLPIRSKVVTISSVPSSSKRLVKYGYNQSEILARSLAKSLNLPYRPLLKRAKHAPSQTKLTRKERIANARSQFSLLSSVKEIKGSVVIVDDVFTTGSTLDSCAAILKSAGTFQVWGVTIAKD